MKTENKKDEEENRRHSQTTEAELWVTTVKLTSVMAYGYGMSN